MENLTLMLLTSGIVTVVALYLRKCNRRKKEKLYKEYGFKDLPYSPNLSRFCQRFSFKNSVFVNMMKDPLFNLQTVEFRKDDVFVASYPKSGTTWTQEIVWLLMNDLDFETAKKIPLITRSPFVEIGMMPFSKMEKMKSPRCLKTHLLYHILPSQVIEKHCKIIYVIRNPKDVVISYYYHHKSGTLKAFSGGFPEFWNLFMSDGVYCSPFWDHILGYWKRRYQDNLLIIKYEDMKKDLKENIIKIAQFLGKSLTSQQIDKVADHCTFKNMKQNPSIDMRFFKVFKGPNLVRKGIIGDWKNHLTVYMNDVMDKWCEKHLAETGLTFEYN